MIGTIEAVSKKDKGPSSLKIGDQWIKFWGYGKNPCKGCSNIVKGNKVKLTTEEKDEGQYGVQVYATEVVLVGHVPSSNTTPSKSSYVPDSDRQALIVAQSCLKAAVDALGAGKTLGEYKRMATEFADFCFNYTPMLKGQPLAQAAQEVLGDDIDPFND